jgi:type II secretory pathway component GspD/PulD (secretin)
MTPHLSFRLRVTLIATLVAGGLSNSTSAQFDGGGRRGGGGFDRGGGFGGGPGGFPGGGFDPRGGISGILRNDGAQQELGITDQQREALDALNRDESGRDSMRDVFDRSRRAESDEERQAIQAEMQQMFADMQTKREEQIKGILDERQFQRANELSLQRSGTSSLTRDDVAESLGLDESQRGQLTSLNDEYRTAREELGFRASDEDRQKLREEFDARFLGVLNESQRSAWTAKLGTPATFDLNSRGSFGPTGGDRGGPQPSGGTAAVTPAPAPIPQPQIIMAPPEGAVVVSSFGAPPGAAGGRSNEESNISFNFRYAPWVDVLKLFADRAGFTLDLATVPPGTFNYYDNGTYTVTEALDILNGYLLPKGYVLVRRDRFLACLNFDTLDKFPPNTIPTVDREELYTRGLNELMQVVFALEGANIDETVKEVQALLGPQGKATGLKATSSVIATDVGGNLRRVDKLLQQISAAPESTVFKSYALRFIAADEAEVSVRALFGLQVGVTDISAGNGGDRGGFDPRDPRSWDRSRSDSSSSRSSSSSSTSTTVAQPRLYAEPRTNSLMVTATPAQHRIVEAALQVVDIDEDTAGSFARGRRPYLQVYEVKESEPQEVVKTIKVLVPGVVVNEDGRYDKIHIVATESQHQEVASLIRQLDGVGGGEQVSVIPLIKMDPITAAAQLRSMFVRDGVNAPTIEPELYGRQLMIRGTTAQLLQAQQILKQLGEDGTGQRPANGLMSTFSLSGRDPDEMLRLLQETAEATTPNPVRIIRPSQRGPVQDVRTPGGASQPGVDVGTELNDPSARLTPQQGRTRHHNVPTHFAAQVEVTEGQPAAPQAAPAQAISDDELDRLLDLIDEPNAPATAPPAATTPSAAPEPQANGPAPIVIPAAPQPADPKAPVTVTVVGDDLVISTPDPAVRRQMETLVESLMQSVPPRTSWTIFPLEHSDVTSTAAMISQLFPESSVVSADSVSGGGGLFGSLSSGITSMSNSLAGMSGLSSTGAVQLRIIPYPTDNALFVSGPTYKVREVEEMLRILDSGELSASLRERTPRMIPVRYAEIDDVYTTVKEVYKDALENEQDRGARNAANMFAQMMGGGSRRGGDQGGSQPVSQLALGVDRQTSQLIVASSEARYQEIKALVDKLDQAALEARRTIKVVSLQNTSVAQLKSTVSSLMPRVIVSTTGSRSSAPSTSSSSSSSNGSSGGGESRGPDPDQMRRMMEERMRSMQQQSGGSGDRGGDRPSFGGGSSPFGSSGGRPSFGGGSSPFGGGDRGSFRGFGGGDRGR